MLKASVAIQNHMDSFNQMFENTTKEKKPSPKKVFFRKKKTRRNAVQSPQSVEEFREALVSRLDDNQLTVTGLPVLIQSSSSSSDDKNLSYSYSTKKKMVLELGNSILKEYSSDEEILTTSQESGSSSGEEPAEEVSGGNNSTKKEGQDMLPPHNVSTEEYQLHHAARNGDVETLTILLKSGLFNINKGNYDLIRPLHEACLAGHYNCCLLLCNFGADVNLQNIDGASALCDACAKGNLECIELLLQRGAFVNFPFLLVTPLHEVVLGSFVDCAKVLLQAGAEVNASKNHQTPLHVAAKTENSEMLCLLLEYGADVFLRDGRGRTPTQLVPPENQFCIDLLKSYENTPKSLRQVCRLEIRKSVGKSRLSSLSLLSLPGIITRFLEFS